MLSDIGLSRISEAEPSRNWTRQSTLLILKFLYGILRTMLQVGCWPGVSALVNDAVLERPGRDPRAPS